MYSQRDPARPHRRGRALPPNVPANQTLGLSGLIQAVLRQTLWRCRLPVKAVAFHVRGNPRQKPGG